MVREIGGTEQLEPIEPPATLDTLSKRISRIAGDRAAFPVGYLEGAPRNENSRRLVTPELRLQVPEARARAIAGAYGLRLKAIPGYAPGWAILVAPGPLEALHAVDRLRAAGEPGASVLLAASRSKRAMPNDPLVPNQWHLKNSSTSRTDANLEGAWNYGGSGGVTGTGIRIGIVDDGLQTAHPDLVTNVDTINDYDWNGADSDPNPGTGDDHGTACAGNAAARGNNGLGGAGTAPEATLVGLRLIAASVTDAQEAEAMDRSKDLIQIKSNSWGPSDTGTVLEGPGPLAQAAFRTAVTSGRGGLGTIFLWAGGNGGNANDNSNYDGYANAIETIAIGATDSLGNRAYYSEPGANLVVCAPSSGASPALGITTVDRTGANGYNTAASSNGGDYTNDFGGTSSATPTAAGIVALMLQRNPNLGWRDVQEILIRSAFKFNPSDPDWTTNGAGFSFNHQFGAGLIDAAASVARAATWTNLTAQAQFTSPQSGLSVSIPENNQAGITRSFDFSASNLRVEHVTLRLGITHTARGNLEISLTSPGGMVSRLAEVRPDTGDDYTNWTFSSVRHWGEDSRGTWTLRIADRSLSGNTVGGTLTAAEMTVFGTNLTPTNPAPSARIDQPTAGSVFSPGSTVPVQITATDATASGATGMINQVELFMDGISLGIDSSAPYTFSLTPAPGSHALVAKATDSEGATGESASVSFTVANQPPVIASASLNAAGIAYTDAPLRVAAVAASDPEGVSPTFSYQWESSADGLTFSLHPEATGATLNAASTAAKLWRCVITASDGEKTSIPFVTAAVNLITPPPTTVLPGASLSYQSGLVLRGTGSTATRTAIINEFSQGSSGFSEWIELLTLRQGSLEYWDLSDAAGNMLLFQNAPVWATIPAGTLIVVYNSAAAKDSLLPADDSDPADGRMVLRSDNTAFFDPLADVWLPLGNSGDSIFLSDAESNLIHGLAYGSSTATSPNIGAVGSGRAAYYTGDSDAGANVAGNWTVTTSQSGRAERVRALLPGVVLTGGSYTQNFDTTPGASGTSYPDGWTCYNGGTEDTVMTVGSNSSTAGGNYNHGSRIGLLGSGSGFDSSSLVLALHGTNGCSAFRISYDVIKIRESTRSHDFKLQYSLSSPTSGFVDVASGVYTSGTLAEGTVTNFSLPLPSSFENQSSTVYLRWLYTPSATPGSGSRDALALDNLSLAWTGDGSGGGGGSGGTNLTGVTPGTPNSPANQAFVTALRSGLLASPALFRLGAGTNLPLGLSLDPGTGLLSGIVATTNPPGAYPIVIERHNSLGETVSHTFTLSLGSPTFTSWLSGFHVGTATSRAGDFDGDGLGNALEHWLGSRPDIPNPGLSPLAATGTTFSFRHSRSNLPATDVVARYEWSPDLISWFASGESHAGVRVDLRDSVVNDTIAPANDLIEVTATVVQGAGPSVFVRLTAQ